MNTDNYLAPNFNREYHSEDISDDDLEPVAVASRRKRAPPAAMRPTHMQPQHVVIDVQPPTQAAVPVAVVAADKVSGIWGYIQEYKIIIAIVVVIVIVVVLVVMYLRPEEEQAKPDQQTSPPQQPTPPPTLPPPQPFGPRESYIPLPEQTPPTPKRSQPKARPVSEEAAPAEPQKPMRHVTATPAAAKPSRLSAHDELTRTSDDATLQRFMNLEEKDNKATTMVNKRSGRAQPANSSVAKAAAKAETEAEPALEDSYGLDDLVNGEESVSN